MNVKKFPKSVRKYIRKEKARIRRGVLDLGEQGKLINGIYQKFLVHNQSDKDKKEAKKEKKEEEKTG